ncbi:alpha-glucuronidase family glycosyl hydrolase [Rhodocytophaga aerolata]|uniref:Xylan alpha-1,2-glucuronidase n=1 Tax=Rhodocytophaga aerolata TaxID=455078 RepID=A0ABT8R7N1_9BACT|nr:alpha-glucuronidase family glycosyl hydrolase [Rhodocytophaga aerolata]MDO1448102.1 alpha-glucuronidase family glycosyl hydrolase [Rhodocytophaga aerolata]
MKNIHKTIHFTIPGFLCFIVCIIMAVNGQAEDGYRLWLRYDKITNAQVLTSYKTSITELVLLGNSPTVTASRKELQTGLSGLLGIQLPEATTVTREGALLIGTPENSPVIASLNLTTSLQAIGKEGFLIQTLKVQGKNSTVITANSEVGVLYGVFHFLKLLQTHQNIQKLAIQSSPKLTHRILNHWDNLDRTVERGYAGFSLWEWHKLPGYIDPRYTDYARANASIGINGTVLTNVNANALVITPAYLEKVKALADVFRPYGIKVYLTARFSAPVEIGGLKTADPLDPGVKAWWNAKADEIYKYVPDFGGFLVKANSEGQPGPQNYGRNHADGANMLADALAPYGGIVMWRAFVYDNKVPDDRAKQAYTEFVPLDGKFRDNVLVQVKNGPVDFQPREPFHPLFGAMPKTPLMVEFQITQEYLGFSTHLAYLSTLFEECLDSDTYAKGPGSTVAKVIDGSLHAHKISGMAGVANIGTDRNWTGHPFGQANWYSYGRLAWDPYVSSEAIADEWIKMTFSNEAAVVNPVKQLMLHSREAIVNYMMPLGLHHLFGWDHHYGPGPWIKNKPRADWTSVYYHQADSLGIGFNRTVSGSNALSQYFPVVREKFSNPKTCPEEYLLWFHHLPWDYTLKSGKNLWEGLVQHYYMGVDSVRGMQKTWNSLEGKIDADRFAQVQQLLKVQEKEAILWRNSCVLYFQTFSRRPIPAGYEKPDKPLEYYEKLEYKFVPGI